MEEGVEIADLLGYVLHESCALAEVLRVARRVP
jgi:hypothetical protein